VTQFSWPANANSGIVQRFVDANGLRFELAEMLPPCGIGNKLAICLHGFPELNYSWRYQMPMLANDGWRVWAPNMRGYGASSRPDGRSNYAINHLLDDVAALIDAAQAEHPASEVMLVAHDWGAIVAWMFAIKKLRPLTRLVIMNVPHPKVARREIRKWRQFWKSWYIFFFQLPTIPEKSLLRSGAQAIKDAFYKMAADKSRFPPDVLQVYADAALRPGAITAMVNYYRALLRDYDLDAEAGDGMIAVPTLMIWGEEDAALNIHCTDGTEQWVAGLTLHRLPGVSHWVQQEAPEQVNAILAQWLAK
jgi:pimeloyl-ACP methyl ester carboxylesterase